MPQTFWKRSATEVARSMRGLMLVVGDQEALIIDVSAYPRKRKDRGLYAPMHQMESGRVYCPRLMNSVLLCIVTGTGDAAGSRVRIDDIELRGVRHTGPGRVTTALGITTANLTGSARVIDDLQVQVDLDDQSPRRSRRRVAKEKLPWSDPVLGKKILARLMPMIVDRYLHDDPPISFEGYVNALLRECETEIELRQKIRS